MDDDGARIRERDHLISARNRVRRSQRTKAQTAVERNAEETRRLIESDELLTAAELERARTQIQIAAEEKRQQEWHDAQLHRYKARTEIRNTRAWILTVNLGFVCAWGVATLIGGEAAVVPPADIWHYLTSIL
jgi:hypothetical protein